jgi:hypothetical protein
MAVLLLSPPSMETEKSELYCEVVPGEMSDAGLDGGQLQEAAAVQRQVFNLLLRITSR